MERKSFVEKYDIAIEQKSKKKKVNKSKASNTEEEDSETAVPNAKTKKKPAKPLKQVKVPEKLPIKSAKKTSNLLGNKTAISKHKTQDSSISNSATSSDAETKANQKGTLKNIRNLSPPPLQQAAPSRRKRKTDSESQSDVGSPFKSRLTSTRSPTRQTTPKKSARNVNGKRAFQEGDSDSDRREFKREKSLEINDTNAGALRPLNKPPATVFEYYLEFVYKGKAAKAKKTFESLKKTDKKSITIEYNAKVETYVKQLKAYLSSLSKEDAVKYVRIAYMVRLL